MDAQSAPAETSAKAKNNSSGCMMLFLVVGGLLAAGLLWNAVTGSGGDSHSKSVDRSTYGTAWPLTVDSAKIGCENGQDEYVQVGSIRYSLNGTAKADGGYDNVDAIWADDPSSPGLKMSIAPLVADAQKLC